MDKSLKCQPKDKFGELINEGDLIEVQSVTELQKVFRIEDDLYFQPYGHIEKVKDYFSNDLVLIKRREETFLEWLQNNTKN